MKEKTNTNKYTAEFMLSIREENRARQADRINAEIRNNIQSVCQRYITENSTVPFVSIPYHCWYDEYRDIIDNIIRELHFIPQYYEDHITLYFTKEDVS